MYRLQKLLSSCFVGLAVVPLLVVGVVLGGLIYSTQVEQAGKYAESRAATVAHQVSELLLDLKDIIAGITRYRDFVEMDRTEQRSIMLELLSWEPMIRDISLVDSSLSRTVMVSSTTAHGLSDTAMVDSRDAGIIRQAFVEKDIAYGEVYIDGPTGEPLMAVAIPVRSTGMEEMSHALYAVIRLKIMWEIVAEYSEPPTASCMISLQDGQIVAHPDSSLVLGERHVDAGDGVLREGISGDLVVAGTRSFLVGRSPWTVSVEIKAKSALRPLFQSLAGLGLVMVLASCVAFGGVRLARRRLLEPILKLTDTARAIRDGESDSRAEGSDILEIDQMSQAFNDMTTNLNNTVEELQQEIAARRETEAALRDSEERFDLALSAVSDGLWDWNIKDGTVYFSPRYYHMLGYEAGEFPPSYESWRELLHPDDRDRAEGVIRDVFTRSSGGVEVESFTTEFRMRTREGDWIWVLSRGRVVAFDEEKQPGRMIGTHMDITDRKRAEEYMIQTEKMMSLGGLAAGMAHEINNPLAGILGNVQNIERRVSPGLQRNEESAERAGCSLSVIRAYLQDREIDVLLDGIKKAGRRAADIVANMLDFSRGSARTKSGCRLEELLDGVVDLLATDYNLRKNYDFKKVEVVKRYGHDLPLVNCIRSEIEQVLLNILTNAAHSVHGRLKEDGEAKIIIRTGRLDSKVWIEIEDNGHGMDLQTRRRAFEPFFTTKPQGEGTGLGLSVSYYIVVNNHGGSMEIESTPEKGSVFRIELPCE